MKHRLYVTKWVIARGILVLEGTLRDDEMSKPWRTSYYYIDLPHGNNWRCQQLSLGVECFLTLEEAQADAEQRFEKHAAKTKAEAWKAQEAVLRLARGELQVHEEVDQVKALHAFKPQ